MPYITPEAREKFDGLIEQVAEQIETDGELNYVYTKIGILCMMGSAMGYAERASIISALENAKLEMYRRYMAPYEDNKIEENGDVI